MASRWAGPEEASQASAELLWWPPAKIVGRYLAPFLARVAGAEVPSDPSLDVGLAVEVESRSTTPSSAVTVFSSLRSRQPSASRHGRDVMSTDLLVVAPEDTLGEIAEQLVEEDLGSALVAEYGRLIGILTSRDLLRALAGASTRAMLERASG